MCRISMDYLLFYVFANFIHLFLCIITCFRIFLAALRDETYNSAEKSQGGLSMQITKPDYYNKFSCIAGDSPDTCCAGWQIMIDEKSLKKYRHA